MGQALSPASCSHLAATQRKNSPTNSIQSLKRRNAVRVTTTTASPRQHGSAFLARKQPPPKLNNLACACAPSSILTSRKDSLLLQKPTNRTAHTGGERIRQGSDDEKVLQAWAAYLAR